MVQAPRTWLLRVTSALVPSLAALLLGPSENRGTAEFITVLTCPFVFRSKGPDGGVFTGHDDAHTRS